MDFGILLLWIGIIIILFGPLIGILTIFLINKIEKWKGKQCQNQIQFAE